MAGTKKPRKKYRPKPNLANPLGFVLESIAPVSSHTGYLVDLQLKNSGAMSALLRGQATKKHMDVLVAMSNIVEALLQLGFGKTYSGRAVDGREAILRIVWRAVDKLRFTPTGPEIQALNGLMELHDAQMQVITVKDMDDAIALAKRQLRTGKVTQLPVVPTELKTPNFLGHV